MNKRKLWNGIVIGICAVFVCVTVVLYSVFTTSQIFHESAGHLAEIYEQVNTTFKEKVTDYRNLMRSWKKYINNATGNPDRYEEFKTFVAGQKKTWGFTDFYFINTDEEGQPKGKRSTGEIEPLELRQELDVLIGGKDVGVVGSRPDANDETKSNRFIMFAVPIDDGNDEEEFEYEWEYEGFEYFAMAIIFDTEDIQKSLSVNAFSKTGFCYIVLPDGTVLLQSREDEDIRANFLDYVRESCTIQGMSVSALENKWKSDNDADRKGTVLLKEKSGGRSEMYLTYMPVEFNDWLLVGVVPSGIVNKNMSSFRIVTIVVMAVIFAFIMAAIAWILMISNKQRIKEKELEIKSRETLLDMLTENTNDIFILFAPETFAAEYVSSNISDVLGLDAAAVKQDVRKILDAAQCPARPFTAEGLKKLESGETWERDIQLKNLENSNEYWYRLLLKHSYFKDRDSYIIMLSDRTKDKKMSADLENALNIAKSANEAKSNFLSNMSHDIRTPMNAIIGFSTLLAKDADNPEKVREYIRKITFSGQHLLSLINDILDMSKIESGKTSLNNEEFSLSDLLEELYSIMLPQARAKKQIFEVKTKGVLPEKVYGDKLRLNQILLNLLSNAVKYTQDGGEILLQMEALDKKRHNYAHLRIQVIDNGLGMSEEFVKVIFEPFERETTSATKNIQGTGLGMAITKNIVDLMGGTINVESKLGEGSTFTVELELAVAEKDNPDDEKFWINNNIVNVLVVDDEEDVCVDVKELMRDTGVNISYALSGFTALDMITSAIKENNPYDIVLLDWKMPELDGVETAKRIRAQIGSDVTIIVLTSYSFDEIEDEAKAAGVDLFLPKPFFVSNFRHAVKKIKNAAGDEEKLPEKDSVSLEGMKILAAEDNEINAEILQELLDIEGVECDIAENGKVALEKFEKSDSGRYDMIFMDIQMPVMNGYDSARAIRASSHPDAKNIPIIAMTANAFDDDVKAALDAGMNAHLAKPIDMDKLKDIIAKIRGKNNG